MPQQPEAQEPAKSARSTNRRRLSPWELASQLRSECQDTQKAVRYSTAILAAEALDSLSHSASAVVEAHAALDKAVTAEQLLAASAACNAAMKALREVLAAKS